jgi:sulfatase maturation enzyme AslB (radical SAM superfamily)
MIQTSYFAKAARLPNAVAISQGIPDWYNGARYKPLAPSWELVKGGDRTRFKEEYYQEVLSKLDPKQVAADLDGKVLLCHEKDSTYCHRRIVAEWLEESLGISVPEIKFEPFKSISQRPTEYPSLGLNPYTGCSHQCIYCYRNQKSDDPYERTKKS